MVLHSSRVHVTKVVAELAVVHDWSVFTYKRLLDVLSDVLVEVAVWAKARAGVRGRQSGGLHACATVQTIAVRHGTEG
jgi:hypothetical protein